MGAVDLELALELLCRDERVFLVYDARQALDLARNFVRGLAVIDLDRQGDFGLALVRNLRRTFPELPVIAVSRVLGVP